MRQSCPPMHQGLTLASDIPVYHLNLARLYIKAGKKFEAEKELRQLEILGEKFPFQSEVKRLQAAL